MADEADIVFPSLFGELTDRLSSSRTLLVGRGSASDVVVEHPSVSRRHLEVNITASSATVRDLGSSNGSTILRESGTVTVPTDTAIEISPGEVVHNSFGIELYRHST